MADAQAQFDVNLRGDLKSQSREATSALEELRQKMKANTSELDGYRTALKNLKGNSTEVKAAQDDLKLKIDALKKSMGDSRTAAQALRDKLGDLRQATRQQAQAAKDAKDAGDRLSKAMSLTGGPVATLAGYVDTLKQAMATGYGPAILLAGGMLVLVAGVVAVTTAVVGSVVAFAKWSLGTADAARSLSLLQEAAAGSAENSKAMTTQIDAMSRRVPTARDELQKLYQETFRLANHTRMSGDAIQSTYEAIAQSSAAMGDTVGHQIGDLITRSKDVGVMRIGRLDVQGSGLDYEKDLVEPLARSMTKIGPVTAKAMNDARAQLAIGGLKMDAGAKLVADAVNKRFGGINMRQMLALDTQWQKLKETFVGFTRGINLDPLLKTVQHFFDLFHGENDVGTAFRQIVEILGNGMVGAVSKSGPKLEDFLKNLTADAENFIVDCLEGKDALGDMFKIDVGDVIDDLKQVVELVKGAVKTIAFLNSIRNKTADVIVGAIQGATDDAGAGLAQDALRYQQGHEARMAAKQSPAHADGGVVGVPAPGEFWASVAPGETIVPKGAGIEGVAPKGGGNVTIEKLEVTIQATGRGGADIAHAITESSFMESLQHTLEVVLGGAGIPTNAVPT